MLKKSNRYIPFFTPEITSEEIKSLNKTVKDGWISSQGKIIERFEEEFAKFHRIKYLHCDAQGSDLDVLKSLEKNLKYLNFGIVEVSAEKKRNLYVKSHNNLLDLKKFLKKKNFIINKIDTNDIYGNELNVNFKNISMIDKEFLNFFDKFKLRFYQKFIRKIIMNHHKVFLYQLFFKILNAKYY